MRHLLRTLLVPMLFCGAVIHAEADLDGYKPKLPTKEADRPRPFMVDFAADYITKADIDKHGFKGEHVRFGIADVEGRAVFYYNEACKEGLAAEVGYSETFLDWRQNPYFHQKYFEDFYVGLAAFSNRCEGWLWKAELISSIDAATWNFNEYLTFDALLWGRYAYNHCVGVHIGLLVETGMKIDRVYPIFGFDWQISEAWKLNAVYPVDISLVYQINENWSASGVGRFFSSRHRAHKEDPVPESLFTYRGAGGEFGLTYDSLTWLKANIHAGYTFGNKLTIANKHYREKQHFNLDSSAYFGADVALKF